MDEYKEKDGTFQKKHLTAEEKAVLWHLATFTAVKVGIFIAIRRFAKTYWVLDDKRHTKSLLERINEVADDAKEQ